MSTIVNELHERHRDRLAGFPAPLDESFLRGLEAMVNRLDDRQLEAWAETGVELTGLSLRSWEAALEYFRTAPQLPPGAGWDAIERIGNEAVSMATDSAPLAVAFLRATPATVQILGANHVSQWADLGRRLYKGNWKSSALAAQFFDASPDLFAVLRIGQATRLVMFIEELSRHSYELAAACLTKAPEVLGQLGEDDRLPFLTFAVELAQSSWADSRQYFERGPVLIHKVHAPERERFLLLAARVARGPHRSAFQYLEQAADAMTVIDPDDHHHILELAEQLAPHSAYAMMEFLINVPQALERVGFSELPAWHEAGLSILRESQDGGEAYFRMQSTRGEGVLENLSARVELSRVGEVLRLYAKALTGGEIRIQNSDSLAEKGIGWVDRDTASTDGSTIFLPAVMERFATKDENFAALKVYATHQAAHLEFGSFDFDLHRDGVMLNGARKDLLAGHYPAEEPETVAPIVAFFDLFPDRQLANDIFTIAEAYRIDTIVKRHYGGIRRSYLRMQRDALERRQDVQQMPLRQAFVENLVRASLDGKDAVRWPADFAEPMSRALGILDALATEGSTVEDAADATALLYQLANSIPNVMDQDLLDQEWEEVESMEPGEAMEAESGEGGSGGDVEFGDSGEGMEYESPEEVDFRGDFKPELVQLLTKMKEDAQLGGDAGEQSPQPLTPEQLQELLEKSVEIELDSMMEGDLDATTGQFMDNLLNEAGQPSEQDGEGQPQSDKSTPAEGGEEPLSPLIATHFYDEWDFRAQDYKPRWCAVKELRQEEGDLDFYEGTLQEHAGLVSQTRKQFELMKPELFRKLKRLPDGEDIDLDAAIEWMVEQKAGVGPSDKIYWRRNKIERDVAVAFLVDLSASTDEEINKRDKKYDDGLDDDPRKYLSWWVSKRREELATPPKRIIDVEKESTVLLMTALETIGDQYGIFGFSGYGRDNVEFFVIKDFEERFDDHIKKRLDKMTPIRSTRMGPALRHATHKLNQTEAKVKILVLLSDGRPQDHGYGRDRTEKDYAIHDTRQALNEAKRDNITPFCLTVDRAGHDYLKTMCEDIGYEVVADIETLPSRLPTLYRRLTE